jgi:hypothetical protein
MGYDPVRFPLDSCKLARQQIPQDRQEYEQVQGLTVKIVVTAIVTGIVGAFWFGFKTILGK